jgi:membrane protein YqaA with SNARE-associated domain
LRLFGKKKKNKEQRKICSPGGGTISFFLKEAFFQRKEKRKEKKKWKEKGKRLLKGPGSKAFFCSSCVAVVGAVVCLLAAVRSLTNFFKIFFQ